MVLFHLLNILGSFVGVRQMGDLGHFCGQVALGYQQQWQWKTANRLNHNA